MKFKNLLNASYYLLLILCFTSCSQDDYEMNLDNISSDSTLYFKNQGPFEESKFYTAPNQVIKNNRVTLNTPNNVDDGDDSRALNRLISEMPNTGGTIVIT